MCVEQVRGMSSLALKLRIYNLEVTSNFSEFSLVSLGVLLGTGL